MSEIRVFDQNKIVMYEYHMHYEDIPVFEELLQDEDICEFDLAYPMIVVKVEPILHTSDNAIEITYYVGFTNRDEKAPSSYHDEQATAV